jgi:hypothetical protein
LWANSPQVGGQATQAVQKTQTNGNGFSEDSENSCGGQSSLGVLRLDAALHPTVGADGDLKNRSSK